MKTEPMNGIDVPALKAFVDSVENYPDRRTVGFRVTTEWKGQTKSVGKVSSYLLGGEEFSRDFEIHADEPFELLGGNTAPNPQELLIAALNACLSVGYSANAAAMGLSCTSWKLNPKGDWICADS
jgi:organic hydroperoxide reductase OsmC/OhrA